MNKEQKKEIKIIPILIIFVIASLFISAILIAITPQKEKISQADFVTSNYNDTKSTFKKVTFTGREIVVPEKFKLYQPTTSINLINELADKIIKDYQLEQEEKLNNYWTRENYTLIKNSYESRWSFDLNPEKIDNKVSIVSSEAVTTCFDFYSKYNINLPLIAQEDEISYLDGKLEQEKSEPEKALYLQIPLTYELDGYPVFYQSESNYPFFCKINNNYEIERIVFKDSFYIFESVKEMPSISIDQAIKNIKNEKASVIDAQSQIAGAIDLNWINEADLQSVSIDYRFDENLKLAYPFYKFKAKLSNDSGTSIQAILITPAVETAVEK